MPAGRGRRCESCYWDDRRERSAAQLVELLRVKRVREAFVAFSSWLPTQTTRQRAALGLRTHVEFFEMLDCAGDSDGAWTGEWLLKAFGAAMLRRYELPLRWLQMQADVVMSTDDKTRDSDSRRARKMVSMMPEGSVARELLEAFHNELQRRREAGNLTERSIRLALRPALALLTAEDPLGSRPPSQTALERYLCEVPGQRAAVSTFLGFLRSMRGVVLRVPGRPAKSSAVVRKALEKQIVALMTPPVDAERVAKHWMQLALRYFHHLSASDAKTICTHAIQQAEDGGVILNHGGQGYWIPAEPMTLSGFAAETHARVRVGKDAGRPFTTVV